MSVFTFQGPEFNVFFTLFYFNQKANIFSKNIVQKCLVWNSSLGFGLVTEYKYSCDSTFKKV